MNTAAKEEQKLAALNWVDYADSIRRSTRRSAWNEEFAPAVRSAARANVAAAVKAERPAHAIAQDGISKAR